MNDSQTPLLTCWIPPGNPAWPADARWQELNRHVGQRLIKVPSLSALCCDDAANSRSDLLRKLQNPYFVGDHVALTQTSGWVDAWRSAPSVYAVRARATADVVAAVNFAREHNVRLVVKGGGHSYQGTSCAPDSLLIWTHDMRNITLHDTFVGRGCERHTPQPAVTIEAGAIWRDAYESVTTRGGRYVQGAGCLTVGVAGLVQSGGFGSFSKNYGLAAAGLLEAEIVTADGVVRIANACTHPDLFWGIKGGGGCSLGVITKVTLRTRELPAYMGTVTGRIAASSDAAYRKLIGRTISFYGGQLFNRHWGEQLVFGPLNTMRIDMVFQGLDRPQVENTWEPFLAWLAGSALEYAIESAVTIKSRPARRFWDADYLAESCSSFVVTDDRSGAPAGNIIWAGDHGQVAQFIHGYRSVWLPASLLNVDVQPRLADAIFASTRHWEIVLHCNKGLAGAPDEEIVAARDTAINPLALDAFALVTCIAKGPPAFPGIAEPDLETARRQAESARTAMDEILKVVPQSGSYFAESDFHECNWQESFWGSNYPRLTAIKAKYDPSGLFFTHHGVGSEWNADGVGGSPHR